MNQRHDPNTRADLGTEEGLERLLGDAGKRLEPPLADLEQIRSAAKQAWSQHYAQPARPGETRAADASDPEAPIRFPGAPEDSVAMDVAGDAESERSPYPMLSLLAAAVLFTLVGAGLWWAKTAETLIEAPTMAVAQAGTILGEVWIERAGAARPLHPGDALEAGDLLRVAAASDASGAPVPAIASIDLPSGHSVRIDSGSEARWIAEQRIELLSGRLYISSHGALGDPEEEEGTGGGVVVETVLGNVREIGTQFVVELVSDAEGPSLRTAVREGEVALELKDSGRTTDSARAGEQLVATAGEVHRSGVAVFGEEWQWVLAGASPFAIEGRSGAELLRWLARETGRDVRYQSPAAQRAAQEVFEGASIEVTPETALSLLEAHSLTAIFEGGTIVVAEVGQP